MNCPMTFSDQRSGTERDCIREECGIGVEVFYTGDDLCDGRDENETTCSGLMDSAVEKWNRRDGERHGDE